jgi:thiol-disulfide isomerase/thioredoxin
LPVWLALAFGGVVMTPMVAAGVGIAGHTAPAWDVEQWHQVPHGRTTFGLEDVRGKVIYLYAFQSWCPGCNQYGFPLLRKVQDHYQNDTRVAVIAVQTVFEGYAVNTFERAIDKAREFGIRGPVGHTEGRRGIPHFMERYQTGGTPWCIVIDQQGVVRYNNYHINEPEAIALIDGLLKNGYGVAP